MEKIKIGKIVNAVALKGEVKVYNYSDSKERYQELDSIIVDNKEYQIQGVRFQQETVILKLAGIDDRNAAELMKNKYIFITDDDLMDLPEDTFYVKDLIGLSVIDIETNQLIGYIKDILQNSAQDVYQIEREGKSDVLIPAVSEFIKDINVDDGAVRVKLIPGMIEE